MRSCSRQVATLRGISLDAHKTQRFENVELLPGDLVVAMEPWHAEMAAGAAHAANAQVTLLGLWGADSNLFVHDPYGRDEDTFRRCFARIDSAVYGIVSRMRGARQTGALPDARRAPRPAKVLAGRALFAAQLHRLMLRRRATVVAFAAIVPDGRGDASHMPLAAFDDHCRFFRRHFVVISLPELARRVRNHESIDRMLAVICTDGYADSARLAASVLNKFAMPATFVIAQGSIGSGGAKLPQANIATADAWMTWDDIASIAKSGHDIALNTQHHADGATAVSTSVAEIIASAALIEQYGKRRPTVLATPPACVANVPPAALEQMSAHGFTATVSASGGLVMPASSSVRVHLNAFPMNGAVSPHELGFDILRTRFASHRPRAALVAKGHS